MTVPRQWIPRPDAIEPAHAGHGGDYLRHLIAAWVDDTHAVLLNAPPWLDGEHLMIRRHDGRDVVETWSGLLEIVHALVPRGRHRWALEVWPPRGEIVDEAPMRHLLVLPEGTPPPWSLHAYRTAVPA